MMEHINKYLLSEDLTENIIHSKIIINEIIHVVNAPHIDASLVIL